MDFDKKIAQIESHFSEYKDYIKNRIYNEINDLLSLGEGKKVAIVGGGEHTKRLINDYFGIKRQIIIIDKNPQKLKYSQIASNCKVYGYDKIYDFDKLIISSLKYESEIKQALLSKNFRGQIVDIYKLLGDKGIVLPTEYYNIEEFVYIENIVARNILKSNESSLDVLKYLIYSSLENRDLISAKEYLIKIMNITGEKVYNTFLKRINEVEVNIASEFKKRSKKDFLFFWVDGLRYDLSKELSFYNDCRKKGMDFLNVYSSSISTRNTYGCLFENKDEMDLFNGEREKKELIDFIYENGYDGIVSNGLGVDNLDKFNYKTVRLGGYNKASSKIIWDAFMFILSADNPIFAVIHLILETHTPFMSPISDEWKKNKFLNASFRLENDKNLEEYISGVRQSASYIDQQLEYYINMVKNAIFALFTDHGYYLKKNRKQFMEDMAHVPFCIWGQGITVKKERRLTSTRYIGNLIKYIISNDNSYCNDIFYDYLNINGIDAYNKVWIDYIICNDLTELGIQFCGIRTLDDIYVLEGTGQESYYILPDEENNAINNKEYQERIEYLRGITRKKIVDIYNHPKFINSIELYNHLGKSFVI